VQLFESEMKLPVDRLQRSTLSVAVFSVIKMTLSKKHNPAPEWLLRYSVTREVYTINGLSATDKTGTAVGIGILKSVF
jgi:hypothetical protein